MTEVEYSMQFPQYEENMRKAVCLAKEAAQNDEIPVGCVIVRGDEVIAACANAMRKSGFTGHHAEIIALEEAVRKTGAHSLDDCTLYTTLEPCGMCSGAIAHYRVGQVVFGAYDKEYGCMFSKLCLPRIMGQEVKCIGGVLEEECTDLLNTYFKQLRSS